MIQEFAENRVVVVLVLVVVVSIVVQSSNGNNTCFKRFNIVTRKFRTDEMIRATLQSLINKSKPNMYDKTKKVTKTAIIPYFAFLL